jgi:hypothetical protein
MSGGATSRETAGLAAASSAALPVATASGNPICGKPVLRSPYSYHAKAGLYTAYRSGKAGLPTYGKKGTDFPAAKAGVIFAPAKASYQAWQLRPNTVYYLEPGVHIGNIQARTGDVFVGGYYKGQPAYLSGAYEAGMYFAIDSSVTDGDQQNVTVEYLTIQKFKPNVNAGAINTDANTGWLIKHNTITLNVPGAGVMMGTGDVLQGNCLTLNGQYGFQSEPAGPWGLSAVTGGPHSISVAGNEISYNDTCDFEGLLSSPTVGWKNYNPVGAKYRNPHCGKVVGNGDQGGFKLWETDNVTISRNYIHNNWGPGAWADTNNANTTYLANTITNNDAQAILEEVSYNFGMINNYMANNDRVGVVNPGYPLTAVYVSESGSDTTFGGVPGTYRSKSVISGNRMVNNGGGIFIWQNSNRHCADGSDGPCTLVRFGGKKTFTTASCATNLATATINTTTLVGLKTGSPAADWFDGCMWRSENISITGNTFEFNPAKVKYCTQKLWPTCGMTGVFSEYGGPPDAPGWAVATQVTFFQHNLWAKNVYKGPWKFDAWNLGNGNNPVTWADWTGKLSKGDKCGSANERRSGFCIGPFGQDAGSTYTRNP